MKKAILKKPDKDEELRALRAARDAQDEELMKQVRRLLAS